MADKKTNIVLIGMPGAGKSTIGVLLAKELALDFIDTDLLIQSRAAMPLQQIVDTRGHLALRTVEEEVLLTLDLQQHVIATGGSAAYSKKAMQHLRKSSIVVFLDVSLDVLNGRIDNFASRGLAKGAGQSFADLFEERRPLYQRYADVTIASSALNHSEICERIVQSIL